MGGALSTQTQSSQPMTIESTRHVGNTVVIAVDGSKEADMAFMCKQVQASAPSLDVLLKRQICTASSQMFFFSNLCK